jgi:hypothetical protein
MHRIATRKLVLTVALAALMAPAAHLFAQSAPITGTDPEPQITGTDPEPQDIVQQILTFWFLA